MKFGDILLAVVIILIFVGLYLFSIVSVGLKKLETKWPEYRCNPLVMPFASYLGKDATTNFTYCISTIMGSMMGFFLQPINFTTGMLGNLGGIITKSLNDVRKLQNFLRDSISNITGDIFGIFMNILISFQAMIMNIKDLIMKQLGIAVVIMNLMKSANLTGESVWKGPIGSMIRTVCFKNNTPIKLKSGEIVRMKNLELGDIIENGSEVIAILKIKGNKENPFYKIFSEKLNKYIYVTGSHKIQHPETKQFVYVEKYEKAIKTSEYETELSCLVTDDHLIQIGEHTFWDWED